MGQCLIELFQTQYLCIGRVATLRAFRHWIATKKCRQVGFELLSCRSDHAIGGCRGTRHSRWTCETQHQENIRLFKRIYKEVYDTKHHSGKV
jgi:hypothetical protein